jgi:hypothetical protein
MRFLSPCLQLWRRRLSLTLATLVGALALTTAMVIVQGTVQSSNASLQSTASSAAAPPVVTGVIRYHGKLMAGVEVVLFAEPPSKTLKKVQHGKNVPFKVIGSGKTNKDGRYAVSVTGAGLRQARAYSFSSIHVVNLEVAAYYGKLGAQHWFSRKLVLGALANALMPGATAQAMAPLVVDLSLQKPYIPASMASELARYMSPDAPGSGPGPIGFCDQHIAEPVTDGGKGMLGPQETVVGATYSNMADVTMGFDYGIGQDSTLGIAISITPPPGFNKWGPLGLDFTIGGTTTVSSTGSVPFTSFSGYSNHEYLTNFTYQEYFEPCNGFSVVPVWFDGGSASPEVFGFAGTNQYCFHYEATTKPVTQSRATAYTYNFGVDISFWIEFDLSSQTGYDKTAELEYTFPKGGWLCGTTGAPQGPAAGNLLYAGKYEHSPKRHKTKE